MSVEAAELGQLLHVDLEDLSVLRAEGGGGGGARAMGGKQVNGAMSCACVRPSHLGGTGLEAAPGDLENSLFLFGKEGFLVGGLCGDFVGLAVGHFGRVCLKGGERGGEVWGMG